MIPYDLLADIALTRIENPTAKIVLLALARYSNSIGECFPSRDTLSEDSCLSIRTIVSAIQWLKANGYIHIESRNGTSNFYIIIAMEDEMKDPTRAKSAHEVDSNITKLDFTNKVSLSSRAKSARPHASPFFEAFWNAYPRRIGKGAARISFARACDFANPNDIVQAAIVYSKHCLDQGTEIQFIPHPSTWLNQERWEDDLVAEKAQVKKTGSFLDEL